jgi:hypothetical protein
VFPPGYFFWLSPKAAKYRTDISNYKTFFMRILITLYFFSVISGCSKFNDVQPGGTFSSNDQSIAPPDGSSTQFSQAVMSCFREKDTLWYTAFNGTYNLSFKLVTVNLSIDSMYNCTFSITNEYGNYVGVASSLQLGFSAISSCNVSGAFQGSVMGLSGSSDQQPIGGNFYNLPVALCAPN